MNSRVGLLVSGLLLLMGLAFLNQLRRLEARIQVIEEHAGPSLPKFEEQRAKLIKKQAAAVLSIRCQDSTVDKNKPKPQTWNGTATKVSDFTILTAWHLLNPKWKSFWEKAPRTGPIKCELFSRGTKVGTYDGNHNNLQQIDNRDIVLVNVNFTDKGLALPALVPENRENKISLGQTLVLATHPYKFINDYLITFGQVLNDDATPLIPEGMKSLWTRGIITNMTATEGSSGSPLFNLEGEFIGLHVGGEREKGVNTNYQLLFDNNFQVKYLIARLYLSPERLIRHFKTD